MKVHLWGTRGSIATASPETARYGGNTACVEVRGHRGEVIILDAGSGIRPCGDTLAPDIGRVDILLSHLHMDHIQGLGFFRPWFRPELEVHVWGPASVRGTLWARLTRYLSPPLFPVRLRDLPSNVVLHEIARREPLRIGEIEVTADPIIHPGPTVGYRLSEGGVTIAYLPDHEPALGSRRFPAGPRWTSGLSLAVGADLAIHDAQYTDAEYLERQGWGHSTLSHAMAFAALAGTRRLVAFHRDPAHDDAELDALIDAQPTEGNVELVPGLEGMTFELTRPTAT